MFDIEGPVYTIIKRFRIEIIFVIIALLIPVLAFTFLAADISDSKEPAEIEFRSTNKEELPTKKIFVDISGAVMNPDVYELPAGSRLVQVVDLAGGLANEADVAYFSKNFNKARILADQDKIYIPSVDEVLNSEYLNSSANTITDGNTVVSDEAKSLININEASTKELETLPSIGETTANKIADNRPYATIDDLISKKVVSSSVFNKIKALITL